MKQNGITLQSMYLLVGRLALPLGAFVILIAIARVSDQLLGEYALVTTYYFILQTLPLLGLTPFYMREVARSPNKASHYFLSTGILIIAACIIINISIYFLIRETSYSDTIKNAIYLVGLTIVPGIFAFMSEITLTALHNSKAIVKISLIENAIRVIFSIATVLAGQGIEALIWVLLLTRCLSFCAYIYTFHQKGIHFWRSSIDKAYLLRSKKVLPIFFTNSVLALSLSRLDFVVLSLLDKVQTIGYYAIGYRLFEIVGIAINAILSAFYPKQSRAFHFNIHHFRHLVRTFIPIFIIGLGLASVSGAYLSDWYVKLLFAAQYPVSVHISELFMLLLTLHGLDQFLSLTLNACDQQRKDATTLAVGAPVYLLSLVYLIPQLSLWGAFIATTIVLFTQLTLRMTFLYRSLTLRLFTKNELVAMLVGLALLALITYVGITQNYFSHSLGSVLAIMILLVCLKVGGLLRPFTSLSYHYARAGAKLHEPSTLAALCSFIAYDHLRYRQWMKRKMQSKQPIKNFGFVAVLLIRVSRYLWLNRYFRFARFVWQINTIITKCDIRENVKIGPGLVLDAPIAVGISGELGHSSTFFGHTAMGCSGKIDIGAGRGFPVVGYGVIFEPRAYLLGGIKINDDSIISAHAQVLKSRQIKR